MSELVSIISKSTGLSEFDVMRVILTAPNRYKEYTIDKRSGGKRLIAHPAAELKAIQRCVVERVLKDLPIHECATAYEPKASIKKNASKHADAGSILKMDFKDFFPSIKPVDWEGYCTKHRLLAPRDVQLSSNILFYRPTKSSTLRLAIGAPSSPKLSNLLMYQFDKILFEATQQDKITYTRYADDLTFSAPRSGYLRDVGKIVRNALRSIEFPKLKLNDKKTILLTKKYRRQVTGLVLTQDGGVSIGRGRKRQIRSKLHHFARGDFAATDIRQLHGLLSFARDIEPNYYRKILERYGEPLFNELAFRAFNEPD
jgi:RNA-directed DNA polymerase